MFKAYKYRIYPNLKQQELIQKTFEACNFIYNYYLQMQIDLYSNEKKRMSAFDCNKDISRLKKDEPWLKEVSSQALYFAIENLEVAFQKFFKEHVGFPKFKTKDNAYRQSYSTKGAIHYSGDYIMIPKLGFVKTRNKLIPEGRIINITVIKEPSNKYYASLCCTEVEVEPFPLTGNVVGLAFGPNTICVTSDGKVYENKNFLKDSLNKLAKLQRELQRKEKGSANYEKARIKVAKLYEHIANQRKDYLQKITTEIIKNYDVIYMVNPTIKQVMKNNNSALQISDASIANFIFMLKYKAAYYGKNILFVKQNVLLDINAYDVDYLKNQANEILSSGLVQQSAEETKVA